MDLRSIKKVRLPKKYATHIVEEFKKRKRRTIKKASVGALIICFFLDYIGGVPQREAYLKASLLGPSIVNVTIDNLDKNIKNIKIKLPDDVNFYSFDHTDVELASELVLERELIEGNEFKFVITGKKVGIKNITVSYTNNHGETIGNRKIPIKFMELEK